MDAPCRHIPDESTRPTDSECYRYRYETNVVDRVTLPQDICGLVGIRYWQLDPGMYIVSATRRRRYDSSVIWADRTPTATNRNGIYAHQLPAADHWPRELPILGYAFGIVELSGHVVVHEDGVLRGERCRILMLIARADVASYLSRIYGVPVMVPKDGRTGVEQIESWLRSCEGVAILKWNVDLISEIQAKRLLSQVEGLKDELQKGQSTEETPEDLKDKGELVRNETDHKAACGHYFALIARNAALDDKFPTGRRAFGNKYGFLSNTEISVLQVASPNSLNEPLTEMLSGGLSREEDYVLIEPMCLGCRLFNPKAKTRPRRTRLHPNWLRDQVGWLNASIEGRYYWHESTKSAGSTSKPQTKRKHGIAEWINTMLHGH